MTHAEERAIIRELAKKTLEIANLPVMKERENLWYAHNALKGARPVIVMEMLTFEDDLLPPPRCESPMGRRMEKALQRAIVNHELIDDDKVVSAGFEVPLEIKIRKFDLDEVREYAEDFTGHLLGFRERHAIRDLEEDFPKLRHSTYRFDREATESYKAFAGDVLGDLMPVVEKNKSLEWHFGISQRIIELMGMESLMIAMADCPETVLALYNFVADDMMDLLRWQEENGLTRANNGNDYAGAGSYGFTRELSPGEPLVSRMLWGNMNSQETVSISPRMYHELVFPAYERLAKEFGLLYYGCCEPVHSVWGDVSRLHGLRKVSVSPWCDEVFMGEALRGGGVIYSRKPSPNYIGVGRALDEEAYAKHIGHTLHSAKGCALEIIHRDIYTLGGDPGKAGRAVRIIRREIERLWQ